MDSSGLFDNQYHIYSSLVRVLSDQTKFSIVKGDSGSGKTYLMESLYAQKTEFSFFKLEGDRFDRERPYYPFKNLIRDVYSRDKRLLTKKVRNDMIRNVLNQAGSFSPLGADALSACIAEFSGAKKKKRQMVNIAFNSEELELLFPLDYFCGDSGTPVFLADDLQYWDDHSLQLLYSLIKQPNWSNAFLNNAVFVATINTSVDTSNSLLLALERKAAGSIYNLRNIAPQEYGGILKTFGCVTKLSEEHIVTLYSITNGNLQMTADIARLLQSNANTDETIRQIILNRNLGHLVVERVNRSGDDGVLVNDALKYGALFGNSFYYRDIEPALSLRESKIRSLMGTAQEYYLVRATPAGVSFIHELIREAYQKEADIDKDKYYIGFSKCLKLLYPGDFAARAEALFAAGQNDEACVVNLLAFCRELRRHKPIHVFPALVRLPNRFQDYSEKLQSAYQAFDEGKYRNSLDLLDGIEDIYPKPLLAEKYYLLSLVLSKWLDERSRLRAKTCLEPYLDIRNIDGETDVWERVISAYIVACIHNNDVETALQYEKRLTQSIETRIAFDLEASFRLNTLRRKASSLYSPAVALHMVRKSKDFFAPKNRTVSGGTPLDPVEYYMSLNNYLAVALMAGKASEVFQDAGALINLPHEYGYLKFQRYEMPLNNAVLIAYLNGAISAERAQVSLRDILEKSEAENSTSTIIRVNIAIFSALHGNFESAQKQLDILLNEVLKIKNIEYYYSYLIRVNLAAVLFVQGQKDRCIRLLEELAGDMLLQSDAILELHANALMRSCVLDSGDDQQRWYLEPIALPENTHNSICGSEWNYYGNKYLFGELEFWSES